MANQLFGTDGIRGKANVYPMCPDVILRLGQAVGIYFKEHYKHPRILIGKDTRQSGYMLEQALSSGICSVGVDTFFLGPLPTPGIAYLTRGMRANAGIVISASHNGFQDNGIKIFSSDGYKLDDAVEAQIERIVLNSKEMRDLPTARNIGRTQRIDDAIGQYAVFLKEQFPKHLSLEGLRIVVDCANGAGYRVTPKVLEELGAEVFSLGVSPNGTNINEGCGALHPQLLANKVTLYKADMGIALDGDADRLIVVDHKGEVIDGDEILAICGHHYVDKEILAQNTLVATVMSNLGLDLAMQAKGARVLRTKVGDRYVVEEMKKHNLNLGGEQSGHLIFRDNSTTGDGCLAALNLLQIQLESGKQLHELKRCITRFPQVTKSVAVPKKVPLEGMTELSSLIAKVEKKLGKTGRVLFRYSGTENLARIMLEGEDQPTIENLAQDIATQTMTSIRKHVETDGLS